MRIQRGPCDDLVVATVAHTEPDRMSRDQDMRAEQDRDMYRSILSPDRDMPRDFASLRDSETVCCLFVVFFNTGHVV